MADWVDPLGWPELTAWLAANAAGVRAGRLVAELVVTRETYLSIPGIGVVGVNPSGETVWRKKILVSGYPAAKVALTVIDPTEGLMLG